MNHEHTGDAKPGGHGGLQGRGVTRGPMGPDRSEGRKHHERAKGEHAKGREDLRRMLAKHHEQTLWVYWSIVLLGAWMLVAPATFDYGTAIAQPSGGRELWLSDAWRVRASTWSDVASGVLLVVFGWRSLTPNRPVSLWAACFVGIWLTFAPLVFWAPTAAVYVNDTLVGALVIALTVLVPGMPNMMAFMKMGADVPHGWTYNPSSWPQRSIMIGLAFAGWVVSRYLATYQLGYAGDVADPFFGESTRRVLDSKMSHSLPVSDAGLGALAYTFEFLMGWMGSPKRWRTMPWMVLFFGILVIPLGLVHIFLVISQPVAVGAWCTFCLLAAAIMLPMIPLAADEVVAMGQHMVLARRRGESLWSVFWKGGSAEGTAEDERTPAMLSLPQEPGQVMKASVWGLSAPWTLVVSALAGAALMATPALLAIEKPASIAFHLGGALALVFAVLAMGEVLRAVRFVNVLLGLALAIGPWFLAGAGVAAQATGAFAGLVLVLLALPRGPKKERYGLFDRWVF